MKTILDTGPLVALLNRNDQHHAWTRNCRVFTTDHDFSVYRRNGRDVIPVIVPER